MGNVTTLSNNIANAIEEAHDLNLDLATEILAFLITDTDRIKSNDNLPHVPIAYALKGPSLQMTTCRKLLEIAQDKCKEEGVRILVEVSDGQFSNNAFRSIDNKL